MTERKTPRKSATAQAKELKISQVGDFKRRLGGVFELPSGLVMRLRNPGGMQAFIAAGTIPNSLMATITGAVDKGRAPSADELLRDSNDLDPEFLQDMIELMNVIAVKCCVEPTVAHPPEDDADRDEDQLYTDEVPDDDKMFIFQWITGGTSDLETFRRQQKASMDALDAESKHRGTTK